MCLVILQKRKIMVALSDIFSDMSNKFLLYKINIIIIHYPSHHIRDVTGLEVSVFIIHSRGYDFLITFSLYKTILQIL